MEGAWGEGGGGECESWGVEGVCYLEAGGRVGDADAAAAAEGVSLSALKRGAGKGGERRGGDRDERGGGCWHVNIA